MIPSSLLVTLYVPVYAERSLHRVPYDRRTKGFGEGC